MLSAWKLDLIPGILISFFLTTYDPSWISRDHTSILDRLCVHNRRRILLGSFSGTRPPFRDPDHDRLSRLFTLDLHPWKLYNRSVYLPDYYRCGKLFGCATYGNMKKKCISSLSFSLFAISDFLFFLDSVGELVHIQHWRPYQTRSCDCRHHLDWKYWWRDRWTGLSGTRCT